VPELPDPAPAFRSPSSPAPLPPAPPRPDHRIARPPVNQADPAPGSLRAAQLLWLASFAVLLGLAAFVALRWGEVQQALDAAVGRENAARALSGTDEQVAGAVDTALYTAGGVSLGLVLAQLLALYLLMGRKPGARVALAVLGALGIGAAYALATVLADAVEATGDALVWAPAGQALLIVAAVIMTYAPASTQWLRTGRSRRGAAV
jgi:hypothetical protein